MNASSNLLSPGAALAIMQASQTDASASTKKLMETKELAKSEAAAKEFESLFVAEMLKPMFEGISTDGMFGGGKGEEIFRGILVQEYGKLIAQGGGVGLSSQIREQMIKMQEQADAAQKKA